MRIRGENGKTIDVCLNNGWPYLWIQTPNDDGWSIELGSSAFDKDLASGTYKGQSERGEPRRATITVDESTTTIRIHHPTSGSGGAITVDSAELRTAVAGTRIAQRTS